MCFFCEPGEVGGSKLAAARKHIADKETLAAHFTSLYNDNNRSRWSRFWRNNANKRARTRTKLIHLFDRCFNLVHRVVGFRRCLLRAALQKKVTNHWGRANELAARRPLWRKTKKRLALFAKLDIVLAHAQVFEGCAPKLASNIQRCFHYTNGGLGGGFSSDFFTCDALLN